MNGDSTLLKVKNLRVSFRTPKHVVTAVDDVNIEVKAGQIVALVGESGSGKSVTAMSIVGLLDASGLVERGEIWLGNNNLRNCSIRELRKLRGKDIALIFQDPANALNPLLTIGRQITETIAAHKKVSAQEAKSLALERMRQAGLADPELIFNKYPFQISGGMCQRVMIAIALVSGARLLIADEPTTALDVTIQSQILRELDRISQDNGTGILLITHDLGVVAEIADYVYVMKAGRIVESGSVFEIFANPRHSYTKFLMNCR